MKKKYWLFCILIILILVAAAIVFARQKETVSELSENEQNIYDLVLEYIDQGDAKAAATVFADEEQAGAAFELFRKEQPEMCDVIMLEAMNHFDEDGDLMHIIQLRAKGYITDEVFGNYREQWGLERVPANVKNCPVDAYVLDELIRVYERGGDSAHILIDLRYWGLIDDEMHQALLEKLRLDYTDDVDMNSYVPGGSYLISGEDVVQYRLIQEYIDAGDAISVTELMLQGGVSEKLYAYMMKSDADILDLAIAESLLEYAQNGDDVNIIRLCVNGFVSDRCFEYYWEMIGCELPEGPRTDESYEGIDMYLMHEIEMIIKHGRQEAGFIKTLWMSKLFDDATKEFIVNQFGGWE